MAEHDPLAPYPIPGEAYPPPAEPYAPPAPRYELRPLSVGEILDRIFSLFRAHFWLFTGLSAVSAAVGTVTAILRLAWLHFGHIANGTPTYLAITVVIAAVQVVIYLIAYSLTHAATTSAVHDLYLGRPTSFENAIAIARRFWLRCLGIGLWQGWSALWIPTILFFLMILGTVLLRNAAGVALSVFFFFGLLASFIYAVIAYLRNSLAVPAAVIEDLSVRRAMRRSKDLATSRMGRIFLLLLLFYAIWTIVGLITVPIAFLIARDRATEHLALQAIILAVNFVATTIVAPIAAIGLCLFYFDERVRHEGFDIEFLLQGIAPPPAPPPPFTEPAPPTLEQPTLYPPAGDLPEPD